MDALPARGLLHPCLPLDVGRLPQHVKESPGQSMVEEGGVFLGRHRSPMDCFWVCHPRTTAPPQPPFGTKVSNQRERWHVAGWHETPRALFRLNAVNWSLEVLATYSRQLLYVHGENQEKIPSC